MSSSIYVTFDEDEGVSGEAWAEFCRDHAIRYSPQTVGQSTFYAGEVEICFGRDGTEPVKVDAPGHFDGWRYDWDTAKPPDYAERVTFSTFHYGSAMPQVAVLARAFWLRFGGRVSADEELRHLFAPGATPSRPTAAGEVVCDPAELAPANTHSDRPLNSG